MTLKKLSEYAAVFINYILFLMKLHVYISACDNKSQKNRVRKEEYLI
tara:strand:+ start:1851 stop:1991 length:141 start_codon:yes stop_codon:yes gene_type:complete